MEGLSSKMSKRVRAYYDEYDEWGRLETPAGRLEYERTWAYLQEHLPPGAAVLDIGCGPGRYALALATAGHKVSLMDPSPVQIEAARAKAMEAKVLDRLLHGVFLNPTTRGFQDGYYAE